MNDQTGIIILSICVFFTGCVVTYNITCKEKTKDTDILINKLLSCMQEIAKLNNELVKLNNENNKNKG